MINQMSSSMRNFMEAYSAVHNKEAKEEFYSHKDEISEMDFSLINQTELDDIAPWTTMHDTVNDQMTYYICENFSCRRPTTDIDIAIKYLQ